MDRSFRIVITVAVASGNRTAREKFAGQQINLAIPAKARRDRTDRRWMVEGGREEWRGEREGRKLQDLEIIQPSCRRGYSTDWRAKGPLAAPGRSLARSPPSDPPCLNLIQG